MEITDLYKLPVGTVLQKGKRKRIYRGINSIFVFYSTPSKPGEVTGVIIHDFQKWIKTAEVVTA